MYSYLYISRLGRPSRPPSVFINIETDPRLYSPSLTIVLTSPTLFQTSIAVCITSPAQVWTARNRLRNVWWCTWSPITSHEFMCASLDDVKLNLHNFPINPGNSTVVGLGMWAIATSQGPALKKHLVSNEPKGTVCVQGAWPWERISRPWTERGQVACKV